MCSGWYINWVTWQHSWYNNEKKSASSYFNVHWIITVSTSKTSCYVISLVVHRVTTGENLNNGWPTRWHLLYYILLNLFQTLIRPSSGACDYLLRCVGCIVLTWGVLVLCSGIVCWWCGIRVQAEPLLTKHVEQYIIKQVSSSWSTFIQIICYSSANWLLKQH